MMLLTTVCLLLFLSHARAQGCSESDLGSNVTPGTGGAIAQLFSAGETGNTPDVLVMSSRTVCLAAAATRGNYRFASVIATYDCGGSAAGACPPGPYPRTDQFEFGCVGSVWGDSALLVDERNDPVNSSITTLRRDCSFCISPADAANIGVMNPVDNETHCAACDPSCLTDDDGLGYCTTVEAAGCCNVYQANTCAVSCATGFEADPQLFICERRCPVLPPPLNGTVSHPTRTVGSVATYTCNTDFAIVGGDEMRTCGATSAWDGEELDCSDCPNLSAPDNGMVSVGGLSFGNTSTYTCNDGFFLTGDEVRTCQMPGWSSTAPVCDPCSDRFPNCKECTSDMCTECETDFTLDPDTGECKSDATSAPGSGGGGCGGGCIGGIIGGLLGALLLASAVSAIIYGIYKYHTNPATKLKKTDTEGLNGVARDNPLYVDPEIVAAEVAEP